MTEPVPPLFVFEDADLSAYRSVDEVCGDLEAVDVRNGLFESFDGEGYPVDLLTSGYAVVGAQRIKGQASDMKAVIARVREHARVLGPRRLGQIDIETADLTSLAEAIRGARPEPFRWGLLIPSWLRAHRP